MSSQHPSSPVASKSKPTGGESTARSKARGGPPALSASLLLIAPLPRPARDGHDYRVLLLKRAEKSSTYQNAYVFPGGNVDPVDRDTSAWTPFFPSLASFTAGLPSSPSKSSTTSAQTTLDDGVMQTVKLCAIRETFEESGVLLFEPTSAHTAAKLGEVEDKWRKVDDRRKTQLREEVHANGKKFVELFHHELGTEVRPAVSRLTHWANWVTPVMLPRRFDTHFFISILPSSSSPASTPDEVPFYKLASSDGIEISIAEWLTPTQAIRRALAHTADLSANSDSIAATTATYTEQPKAMGNNPTKSIILHPPQFYLLAELANNNKSYRTLLDETGQVVRPRTVRSFTPQLGQVLDASGRSRPATILPGDEEYNGGKEGDEQGKAGALHRTYVIPPNERTQGLTVLETGVHRRNLDHGPGWEDMSAGEIGNADPAPAKL
ncbi:NUDIX hydrolase [Sporobolomyces koalae]|uniref:NUDIX hydrolase n=1 Tax=Sporobolomyces koalae TaxID=500713 RepID=UPI00317E79DA